MATFELWNVESGNLLGSFPNEQAALAAVVEAMQQNGLDYVDLLALGSESARGRSKIVASGRDLIQRATARAQSDAIPPKRRQSHGA